jgi:hypothetical protein
MARRKVARDVTEPALFRDEEPVPTPKPAWSPRVFVTNDELRTCLSRHLLAINGPAKSGPSTEPVALVAFDAPVAAATLDALRRRGPNAYWIGLELDPDSVPAGTEPPASLPAVLRFAAVRRIVFSDQSERDRFVATRMANVSLPTELAAVDPTWFAPDGRPADLPVGMKGVEPGAAAAAVRQMVAFRRLFGAAIAVLDGAESIGRTPIVLMAFARGTDAADRWCDGTDAGLIASLFGQPNVGDAAVESWQVAAGLRSSEPPIDPLAAVDRRVRAAVIEHLLASTDETLDRQRMANVIESAADGAGHDHRSRVASDRYHKAVANVRRLWRNEVTWERLLDVWPDGFPTLLAAMAMGSVSDADQYPVLHKRLLGLAYPSEAALLARLFYGLRWGIEAIPTEHRGKPDTRRLLESVTWSAVAPLESTQSHALRLERASGRQPDRPYVLRVEVPGAIANLDIDLADVVSAKFRSALRSAPHALSRKLIGLAAIAPVARPYLTWKIRLPPNGYHTVFERGRAVLSGPMTDGEPGVEFAWSDWNAFAEAATRPKGLLSELKRGTDLAKCDQAIDEVLVQPVEAT